MSGLTIRQRLVGQLLRDRGRWLAASEAWEQHHRRCSLCREVKTGASRQCVRGRDLRREVKDAKLAYNTAGEDVVRIFGKKAVEAVLYQLQQREEHGRDS